MKKPAKPAPYGSEILHHESTITEVLSNVISLRKFNPRIMTIALLLSLTALYIDIKSPAGYTEWAFYILPLLIIFFSSDINQILIITMLNCLLIIVGYFFTERETGTIVIIHRILGVLMIWTLYINITIRIRVQDELVNLNNVLNDEKQKYRLLFENTLNCTILHEIITDNNGHAIDFIFLEVNPAFELMVGLKADRIIGKTWREVFPDIESDPGDWISRFGQVALEGKAVQFNHYFGRFDKWYKVIAFHTQKRQFCVMMENISERKAVEERLTKSQNDLKAITENLESMVVQRTKQVQDLSKALILAEQRERKQFSYVLHENLQQLLLSAILLLRQHIRDHETAPGFSDYTDITDGLTHIENALQTTRTLSIELNPPILSSQGLDTSLDWLTRHMLQHYGLTTDLRLKGDLQSIKNETQLMLTQMTRELLGNVVRHAGVKNALLEVTYDNKEVKIIVSDKGSGFITSDISLKRNHYARLGLLSIRERLSLFNGHLLIDSHKDIGTRMIITLPVE